MPFAHRPHAHEEPNLPRGQAALVQGRNHGRVEQRRRLDGVFHAHARPHQQLASRVAAQVHLQACGRLLGVLQQQAFQIGDDAAGIA